MFYGALRLSDHTSSETLAPLFQVAPRWLRSRLLILSSGCSFATGSAGLHQTLPSSACRVFKVIALRTTLLLVVLIAWRRDADRLDVVVIQLLLHAGVQLFLPHYSFLLESVLEFLPNHETKRWKVRSQQTRICFFFPASISSAISCVSRVWSCIMF